jgi:hypothetical protein
VGRRNLEYRKAGRVCVNSWRIIQYDASILRVPLRLRSTNKENPVCARNEPHVKRGAKRNGCPDYVGAVFLTDSSTFLGMTAAVIRRELALNKCGAGNPRQCRGLTKRFSCVLTSAGCVVVIEM